MWKEYFTFSGSERRGFVILTLIVVILLILRFSINYISTPEQINMDEIIAKVDSFQNQLDISNEHKMLQPKFFIFDPNKTSNEDWKRLGLSKKQINTINNYLSKGGAFKTSDDIYKIYGITKTQADSLRPFIRIEKAIDNTSVEDKVVQEIKSSYSVFDPNNCHDSILINMGFSKKVIKTIKNYKSAGGKFYKNEDLKKIYGIDSTLYNRIEGYIIIKDTIEKNKPQPKVENNISPLELNSADSSSLVTLKGIGPVFAGRIIKYRNLLGGYYSSEQLLEVYGFDEVRLKSIVNDIIVDQNLIAKISINFSSVDELQRHPYLDKRMAKSIVKYRSKKGSIRSISEIEKEMLIDERTFQKIFPYLSIN